MAIVWGFQINEQNAHTGQPGSSWNTHGITNYDSTVNPVYLGIHLATDDVEPLLNGNLSDAERLGGQWYLANVIIHEVMASVLMNSRLLS